MMLVMVVVAESKKEKSWHGDLILIPLLMTFGEGCFFGWNCTVFIFYSIREYWYCCKTWKYMWAGYNPRWHWILCGYSCSTNNNLCSGSSSNGQRICTCCLHICLTCAFCSTGHIVVNCLNHHLNFWGCVAQSYRSGCEYTHGLTLWWYHTACFYDCTHHWHSFCFLFLLDEYMIVFPQKYAEFSYILVYFLKWCLFLRWILRGNLEVE